VREDAGELGKIGEIGGKWEMGSKPKGEDGGGERESQYLEMTSWQLKIVEIGP
jgi:hypothetical protein